MSTGDNEGIVMHGGSLQAGNLAVGRGAHIRGDGAVTAAAEVTRSLERFRAELERHADAVPDPAALRAMAAELEREVQREERNPATIRGLLTRVTGAVKAVTPLLAAADSLRSAVLALL
jgi:hypothetical protein